LQQGEVVARTALHVDDDGSWSGRLPVPDSARGEYQVSAMCLSTPVIGKEVTTDYGSGTFVVVAETTTTTAPDRTTTVRATPRRTVPTVAPNFTG